MSQQRYEGNKMQTLIKQNVLVEGKLYLELKYQLQALSLYLEKRKQRKQLLNLEDHLLKDIGVTRQQAIDEANE